MNDSHWHPSRMPDAKWKDPELTPEDECRFEKIVSIVLDEVLEEHITHPNLSFPGESSVLAVHWHPEYVPLSWIVQRIEAMFPNATEKLLIPTQHNQILTLNGFCGLELDCHSREFGLKVQLLIHFAERQLPQAQTLAAMAEYTFRYRASQLYDFLHALSSPDKADLRNDAAGESAALDADEMDFIRLQSWKLERLVESHGQDADPMMLRNKLVMEWFASLTDRWEPAFIQRVLPFLRTVKIKVKQSFSPEYFFLTQEVIEEARSFGAGIIVPHPEQFWPILLADYDIDGYEVWNPQSQAYTNFLMSAVQNINRTGRRRNRPLLTLMGDDCHLGEKCKPLKAQDPAKASREVGLQPAWEDLGIKKTLAMYNIRKTEIISEYRQRLT